MNSIGNAINEDLIMLEQEVTGEEVSLSDANILDLKETCQAIEKKIEEKYKEAGVLAARMDIGNSRNTLKVLDDNVHVYLGRLRQVRAEMRRARSTGTPTPDNRSSPGLVNDGSTATVTPAAGYKPFLERLKPPTFSGKIEDWPEFRSVWKDLLSDYPESVQVQHLKSNIPAADAKRVIGVKTMKEMWERLEKV